METKKICGNNNCKKEAEYCRKEYIQNHNTSDIDYRCGYHANLLRKNLNLYGWKKIK